MPELLLPRVLRIADRRGESPCTVRAGNTFTYGELGGLIRRFSRLLKPRIPTGGRVAALLDNSPAYVGAVYGIWAAGGVLVGLNTLLRPQEVRARIRHSGARCLLLDSGHRDRDVLKDLLAGEVEVLEVEADNPLPGVSAGNVEEPTSNDLASIIYTSGTTGSPKGVKLSHGNLAANTESICEYLPITADDRALCVLPFPYSYGASVLHTHLSQGASLILEDSLLYPHQILSRIQDEGVTSLAGVPSTFYLFLQRTNLADYDLSSLEYVTQAGARMDPGQTKAFRDQVAHARFFVMYGQTEATARLAYVPPDLLEAKPGSAGRAIPGVELRIQGESGEVLPPGQVGEVCARGDNVMMGYWDDPDETAKALKDGWLQTGDIGKMDEDGFLFLHGRQREMIKSGAHRIAPSEIEEIIRRVHGVRDVAVVGVPDPLLGESVKAWIIPEPAPPPNLKRNIQRQCKQHLALFKIPKSVMFRADFPRTASGKVRKHLLEETET